MDLIKVMLISAAVPKSDPAIYEKLNLSGNQKRIHVAVQKEHDYIPNGNNRLSEQAHGTMIYTLADKKMGKNSKEK